MSDVVLCECFARDGLQHEPGFIATGLKRDLITRFADLGFERVEATSYSNPKVVPQFADATELLGMLPRRAGTWYKATCANLRAVERALADKASGIGANEISLLVSASASHTERNLRTTREAQWQAVAAMSEAARGQFRQVGTVSVAFGCPFEGEVDPTRVVEDVLHFARLGVDLVALGDTTGMATPITVRSLVSRLRAEAPEVTLVAHFHDSRGTAIANCVAAFEAGIRHFDCAFGGVGGHPAGVRYGGGHTGNVATEDLVNLFESMGIDTGIDLGGLMAASEACSEALGRPLDSRVARSGLHPALTRR
jgi:hydroxymethylglutaryl-CoA lyase